MNFALLQKAQGQNKPKKQEVNAKLFFDKCSKNFKLVDYFLPTGHPSLYDNIEKIETEIEFTTGEFKFTVADLLEV